MKSKKYPLKFLVAADLSMALIVNLPGVSKDAHSIWSSIESKTIQYKAFITDLGMAKIIAIVKKIIVGNDNIKKAIDTLESSFEIIEVTSEDIQYARQMSLISNDFDSAIELACAESHGLTVILTDCVQSFAFRESQNFHYSNQMVDIKNPYSLGMLSRKLSIQEIKKEEENILQNGGEDWGNWSESFDKIENRIDFVSRVLEYHYSRDDYFALKHLWVSLNRFTDLYGHYEFRLKWLNVISSLARSNYDINYYFTTLTNIAWTLTMQARFTEAKEQLDAACELIDKIDNDDTIKFKFYHCSFIYEIHCSDQYPLVSNKHIENATKILYQQEKLFNSIDSSTSYIDPRKKQIIYINYRRNLAKLYYVNGDLVVAQQIYNDDVLKKSKEINWNRGVSYAHCKLADIFIDLAIKNQLDCEFEKMDQHISAVKNHIELGKNIAITNKNKRRIAGYFLSEARILRLCGEESEIVKEKYDQAKKYAAPIQDNLIETTGKKELLLII